jgi:hypothetical protein
VLDGEERLSRSDMNARLPRGPSFLEHEFELWSSHEAVTVAAFGSPFLCVRMMAERSSR